MGVQVDVTYAGGLQCQAVHGPSQDTLATDAPKDNEGQGQHFSPTDLLATSLATCMLTTMGIVARRHQVDIQGATARVIKEMGTEPRRHVRLLTIAMTLPASIAADKRTMLERAAHGCPVAASLGPGTQVQLDISYV